MVLDTCQPSKDDDGRPVDHGQLDPELLFGAQGWCEARNPIHRCRVSHLHQACKHWHSASLHGRAAARAMYETAPRRLLSTRISEKRLVHI